MLDLTNMLFLEVLSSSFEVWGVGFRVWLAKWGPSLVAKCQVDMRWAFKEIHKHGLSLCPDLRVQGHKHYDFWYHNYYLPKNPYR